MFSRVVELREILMDTMLSSVHLSDHQWTHFTELLDVLTLPFLVTKRLQKEDLTPGTFLRDWCFLEHSLSNKSAVLAKESVLPRKCSIH